MIIQCPSCKTRFRFDERKITDKGLKVKCAKCSTKFIIMADGSAFNLPEAQAAQTKIAANPDADFAAIYGAKKPQPKSEDLRSTLEAPKRTIDALIARAEEGPDYDEPRRPQQPPSQFKNSSAAIDALRRTREQSGEIKVDELQQKIDKFARPSSEPPERPRSDRISVSQNPVGGPGFDNEFINDDNPLAEIAKLSVQNDGYEATRALRGGQDTPKGRTVMLDAYAPQKSETTARRRAPGNFEPPQVRPTSEATKKRTSAEVPSVGADENTPRKPARAPGPGLQWNNPQEPSIKRVNAVNPPGSRGMETTARRKQDHTYSEQHGGAGLSPEAIRRKSLANMAAVTPSGDAGGRHRMPTEPPNLWGAAQKKEGVVDGNAGEWAAPIKQKSVGSEEDMYGQRKHTSIVLSVPEQKLDMDKKKKNGPAAVILIIIAVVYILFAVIASAKTGQTCISPGAIAGAFAKQEKEKPSSAQTKPDAGQPPAHNAGASAEDDIDFLKKR